MPQRIELAVLVVGQLDRQAGDAVQRGVDPGRRLPHAALRIGPRDHAGDHPAWHERVDLIPTERIGRLD